MSVDPDLVRRIAHLARIKVADDDLPHLAAELNSILDFVEELKEVDVEGVEPMTSVMPMRMKQRLDVVTDGEMAETIAANAPAIEDHYFVVPKVIE
jgi:aspartyl-tRNA(Asn)/glutamyl-tRNA(Gln) amidotransferase subunit C